MHGSPSASGGAAADDDDDGNFLPAIDRDRPPALQVRISIQPSSDQFRLESRDTLG